MLMRSWHPPAAGSARWASDERGGSGAPHRRCPHRMPCRLAPRKLGGRAARGAKEHGLNHALACSLDHRRRPRQSAHPRRDGVCDSPYSWEFYVASPRERRDRCCRSRCGSAAGHRSCRTPPFRASPCVLRSSCGRARRCRDEEAGTTIEGIPRSASMPTQAPCPP